MLVPGGRVFVWPVLQQIQKYVHLWLLVKCGTAECGMETVERWCGTVGKMRNAEICVYRRSFVHS